MNSLPMEFLLKSWIFAAALLSCPGASGRLSAAPWDPDAPDYTGNKGKTIHVSKLGDNTDGSTWARAFHTIQAGLLAVPDDKGGHRVVVRPDVYAEANLYPTFKGAGGSYNLLVGDHDGKLGSGATGWVVVDSGATEDVVRTDPQGPGGGNPTFKILDPEEAKGPETGLKSVDWWGPWRCDPTFSGIIWDRWIYRNIYATGSEGGIGWDLTCEAGKEFSALVEDCVGLGRFAGGAVMAHVHRDGEPVVFRRCYFLCMDVWGDAGGVYVRAHNPAPSDIPDAVFEDCTIIGPDNAVQVGYPGFVGYTRLKFKDCRLFVVNFSQPQGTPATGVIFSDLEGKYLHVDLEDTILLGFKVFGSSKDMFSYSTKGKVRAYVQYRQVVPEGIERLRFWPVEDFAFILPPRTGGAAAGKDGRPQLRKLPIAIGSAMENTPVVFNGKPILVLNHRDDTKNKTDAYTSSMYLYIKDLQTGEEIARFGTGHSFVSAFVSGADLNVFASEGTNYDWFQSIYRFTSTDLKSWKRELAIPKEGDEHLFNVSVCEDDQGYLMAYESSLPVMFCFKFARSKDLSSWEKIPGLIFQGTGGEYSACPVLRYYAPWHYVIYLHEAIPGHPGWIPFLARSKDLVEWELSPYSPILEAGPGEGINNSDLDLFEHEGRTYVFYATGDQATWGAVRIAQYDGPMKELFERYFPEGVPAIKVSARKE
jgi:hypothetical protein